MPKYYVTTATTKRTISCDNPKEAAFKTIEWSRDNNTPMGLLLSVNEMGFKYYNHEDAKCFNVQELVEELGLADELEFADELLTRTPEFFKSRKIQGTAHMLKAEKSISDALQILEDYAYADQIISIMDILRSAIASILADNDKYLDEVLEGDDEETLGDDD